MKKVLMLAVVLAGGIFGYTYFLNAPVAGADERDLANLEAQFAYANQSMMQATRSTGASGLDTTADIEAAIAKVRRVESQLREVKPRLASDASRQRADRLEEKIEAFLEATR